jgi:peptidoglycan/xylan/chitin deacetylase (PgdA/CDA1 family)
MELIARRFHPVSMDDVLLYLKGEKSPPYGAVAITFDDGYKDNFRFAAPILNRFGISGTFYILVDSVDYSKPPWFCLLRHAFLTSRNAKWKHPASGITYELKDARSREDSLLNAAQIAAKTTARTRQDLIERVWLSLDPKPFPEESDLMMTWNDARTLLKSGHIVGSHTVTHPNVAHISTDDARHELSHSKLKLERELGCPVTHFAYPHPALNPCFNSTTLNITQELGYATAVTTSWSAVHTDTCPLAIPRTYAPREQSEFLWHIQRTFLAQKRAVPANHGVA